VPTDTTGEIACQEFASSHLSGFLTAGSKCVSDRVSDPDG
jgi:hypothetical protein